MGRIGPMSEEHKAKIKAGWAARKEAEAQEKSRMDAQFGVSPAMEAVKAEQDRESVHVTYRPKSVHVTYRPFDGDPHSTVWHGVKFRANVPVKLDRNNLAHQIEQLLPRTFPGTNGETLTKHVPAMMFMGDLARGNPSFEVDGHRAPKMVNKRILPPAGHGWAEDHEDQISASTDIDRVAGEEHLSPLSAMFP